MMRAVHLWYGWPLEKIFRKIIHRAKRIGLDQYENPKFYDNFSRALDEALEQGLGSLFLTAWGVGCIVRAFVAMGILISVDAVLLLFVIPPLLGSLYFGLKERIGNSWRYRGSMQRCFSVRQSIIRKMWRSLVEKNQPPDPTETFLLPCRSQNR